MKSLRFRRDVLKATAPIADMPTGVTQINTAEYTAEATTVGIIIPRIGKGASTINNTDATLNNGLPINTTSLKKAS